MVPPSQKAELAQAMAGVASTGMSALNASENQDLRSRYGNALEAYVPVKLDGEVVGAYEIYQGPRPDPTDPPSSGGSWPGGSASCC